MSIFDDQMLIEEEAEHIIHQMTSWDNSFAYGFLAMVGLLAIGVILEFAWGYFFSKRKLKK